ncbi:uncharacterized protein LOC100376942 [Saccoglossus kowalevskii]|uniref:NAD-dependent protein deacetylase sirtuin-3, mitochondrial-like n=1 Tax=Saccoglossus kowalevskii TaxID=10224 RepID=A0ABM0GXQ4_SACKO|nr:PREDICTED: NAD-dependent protein deacetylase sirtuin-3, mitochondrial-like [Saccoglossus kowalevskii]
MWSTVCLRVETVMATFASKARVPVPPGPTRPKSSVVRQTKGSTREVRSTATTPTNKKNNLTAVAGHSKSDSNISAAFHKLKLQDNNHRSVAVSQTKRTLTTTRKSKSTDCNTIEDIARFILNKRCKNIVVMAGAGISTPSGIPDFRTPGTGLYDNLKKYRIPYPEAIFDIDYLLRDARPFFTLAKELYPGNYSPNYVHYFVRMLHEKGLLLRMYTQNIDGLERLAGIPASKLVEAHGTFATSSCVRCRLKHSSDEIKDKIMTGKVPRCKAPVCTGIVKPDIVFFGEDLPKRFYYYLKDFPQCDLLVVMGTSLEVYPFAGIVDSTRSYIPRLLINMNAVGPFARNSRFNDVVEVGDIVEGVKKFARVLGWKKAMDDLIIEQCENKKDEDNSKVESDEASMSSTTGITSENNQGVNKENNNVKNGVVEPSSNVKHCDSSVKDQANAPVTSKNSGIETKLTSQTNPTRKVLPNSSAGPSSTQNRTYGTSASSAKRSAVVQESVADLSLGRNVYSHTVKNKVTLPKISTHQSKRTFNYVSNGHRVKLAPPHSSSSSSDSEDSSSTTSSD